MPTSVEDIVEATAAGVLRALNARQAGKATAAGAAGTNATDLVRAGFFVSVVIRAGGIRPGPFLEQAGLNPQPLPPGDE